MNCEKYTRLEQIPALIILSGGLFPYQYLSFKVSYKEKGSTNMNLGILLFSDVEELDFVGPWEMAGMWNKLLVCRRCG